MNVLAVLTYHRQEVSLSKQRLLRVLAFAVGVFALSIGQPTDSWAQVDSELQRKVHRSFHGPDGTGKDGPMARIGPKLIELYHAYRAHRAEEKGGRFESAQQMMPVVEGSSVVIDAVASGPPGQLQDDLEALGLDESARVGRVVSGLFPIDSLGQAARLPSLQSAAPSVASTGPSPGQPVDRGREGSWKAEGARKTVGETTTEGDVSVYADLAREQFGVDGSGVKTCALSDSYDESDGASTTASEDVRSGDLPGSGNPNGHTTPVEVLDDFSGTGSLPASDEGRAMLQILHDLAPGATLGFHTAFKGLANFAQGIRDLADAGCEVVVDDIFYLIQPMFQDGLVSRSIEEVAATQNVSYYTSAGNAAALSHASHFQHSEQSASSIGLSGSGVLHDFHSGTETDVRQRLRVPNGARVFLSLQWDDPFFRLSGEPGADTDLDVYLLDGNRVVASSTRGNVGGDPWEFFNYRNESGQEQMLDLAVVLEEGPAPGRLKYINASLGPVVTEYATDSPTVFGHSDAESAVSAGASVWANTPRQPSGSQFTANDPPLLNGFSSLGGIPLLFDENGARLSSPVHRKKPDLTAPDGANNTFFGVDFDDDGFPNFFGTSAAAPHAAAVAALMREVRPGLSPQRIERRLEQSAVDVLQRAQIGSFSPIDDRVDIPEGEGDDRFSGTGLIRADRAVRSVLTARVTSLRAEGEAPTDAPTAPYALQWRTIFEQNSDGFVVERRIGPLTTEARRTDDGWRPVAFVPSKAQGGASRDTLRYQFEGAAPTPGQYALRLRHVTQDGSEKGRRLGAATALDIPIGGAFSLGGPQPNPSDGTAEIEVVAEEEQNVRIVLYDLLGRRVQVLHDDFLSAKRPLVLRTGGRELASGTYVLRVRGETFTETRKMIVLR